MRVEIVPARRRGVTGYANVGRGSVLGNPFSPRTHFYVLSNGTEVPWSLQDAVSAYRKRLETYPGVQQRALELLNRDWPDNVVRIACPCNGVEKGQPCHATVIKEFLEAEIARREGGGE